MLTSSSSPNDESLDGELQSEWNQAPIVREQMANVGRNRYDTITTRPLRFPGRWYDPTSIYPDGMTTVKSRKQVNTIQLIMETSWGVQRPHEQKCALCTKRGYECWVFTASAIDMIKHATLSCARCRAYPRPQGCTLNPPRERVRARGSSRLLQTPRVQSLGARRNVNGHEEPQHHSEIGQDSSTLTIMQHPLMTNNPYAGSSSTGVQGNNGQEGSFNAQPYRMLRPRV